MQMPESILVRCDVILRLLKALQINVAFGSYDVPARACRECCNKLASAIKVFVRILFRDGLWAHVLRFHCIQSLHKKGAVSIHFQLFDCVFNRFARKQIECAIAFAIVHTSIA